MRRVHEARHERKLAQVWYDPEWDEYQVRFFADGVRMDASDYHTTDRDDAISTADAAVRDEREWCEANNLTGD